MVQNYEVLLLATPAITGDEAKDLELQLDKVVKAGSGTVVSFERWGKYRLAYEIKKNEYGVYFLMRFDVPQGTNLINDLKTYIHVKLNAIVMRDMISCINPKAPAAYQRPRSLEETPPREEGFSRDNRGGSFFGSLDRLDIDEDSN